MPDNGIIIYDHVRLIVRYMKNMGKSFLDIQCTCNYSDSFFDNYQCQILSNVTCQM